MHSVTILREDCYTSKGRGNLVCVMAGAHVTHQLRDLLCGGCIVVSLGICGGSLASVGTGLVWSLAEQELVFGPTPSSLHMQHHTAVGLWCVSRWALGWVTTL
ncbi:hypothetical protein ILYODFUR_007891 [Ilyodon furcidens]|uniref:Uncharacterized protein n=1 Tax=Ilyodon furcidens TaxID=33524 RepID=A0ABV0VDH4_9TELE